jgi:alpha-tubulin suppressor-like RCC1 family protein
MHFVGNDDPIYTDYKDLLKFTNAAKLSFFEIRCSALTVFLIDNNNELWAWGRCGNGQLGIAKEIYF